MRLKILPRCCRISCAWEPLRDAHDISLQGRGVARSREHDLERAERASFKSDLAISKVVNPLPKEVLVETLLQDRRLVGNEPLSPFAQRQGVVRANVLHVLHRQIARGLHRGQNGGKARATTAREDVFFDEVRRLPILVVPILRRGDNLDADERVVGSHLFELGEKLGQKLVPDRLHHLNRNDPRELLLVGEFSVVEQLKIDEVGKPRVSDPLLRKLQLSLR
mmetsp:Transcript_8639/g.21495  ORF Transcript_8639/g.21495 Transcript_8639/m.21495 type:complete len:222 (-) Transcript_8639:1306-1971(-)